MCLHSNALSCSVTRTLALYPMGRGGMDLCFNSCLLLIAAMSVAESSLSGCQAASSGL